MKSSEKRTLQLTVTLACIVPIVAGLSGMLQGVKILGGGSVDLDSHFRYLSGLLLGIGIAFLSLVPHIERHTQPARMLTMLVVIGGIGRFFSILANGVPDTLMLGALVMELAVTPLICMWQNNFARRHRSGYR